MDFYTFRYRCCFRRTLMCKKVRKKKIQTVAQTLVCPFVCLHFRHRIVCKSLGHFDRIIKFVKYDETLIVQDIILFLYVCRTKNKSRSITQTSIFLK